MCPYVYQNYILNIVNRRTYTDSIQAYGIAGILLLPQWNLRAIPFGGKNLNEKNFAVLHAVCARTYIKYRSINSVS